jgi:hypothetical protein
MMAIETAILRKHVTFEVTGLKNHDHKFYIALFNKEDFIKKIITSTEPEVIDVTYITDENDPYSKPEVKFAQRFKDINKQYV